MMDLQGIANKKSFFQTIAGLAAICLLAAVIGGAQTGSGPAAQPQGGQGPLLQSLLDEVRQLRLALQHSNVNTARAQLAFERLRLQMGRVDALSREIEGVHSQLLPLTEFRAQATERMKDWQEQLTQEGDASRRAALEFQLKQTKFALEAQVQRGERLHDREAQLGTQLQMEQSKLSELEGQLGNLERELSSAP